MDWKHVSLYCPSCEFTHDFKRSCWWEVEDVYIGLYTGNDMRARADCEQHLFYGQTKDYDTVRNFNLETALNRSCCPCTAVDEAVDNCICGCHKVVAT